MVWTRFPTGVVGPVKASARPRTRPGISARQNARSSATSNVIGTNSTPRNSPIFVAKIAGHPPTCPPKIVCKAWRCRSLALSSMKRPIRTLASSAQTLPSKAPSPNRLRPSIPTSPKCPLRTCQASIPAQASFVGAWANSQGQGMLQLQTSTNHLQDAIRERCSSHHLLSRLEPPSVDRFKETFGGICFVPARAHSPGAKSATGTYGCDVR